MAVASEILDELDDILENLGLVTGATRSLAEAFGTLDAAVGTAGKALANAQAPAQALGESTIGAAKAITQVADASNGAAPAVLNTGRAGTAAARGFDSLKGSAMQALENLKPTGGIIGAISSALESMGPKGKAAAIILGIVVSVVTAGARAFWGLVEAAVAFSQEKDALAETFAAITDGAKSGLDVVNELSDVAANLPFTEGPVLAWGKALAAAGKSGDGLVQSINAIAASAAIMQDGGAAALAFSKRLQTAADVGEKIKLDRRMQRMLAETGVRASELAKALGVAEDKLGSMQIDAGKLGDAFETALIAKGGGALEKMSLTWASISGKLADAWGDLFEDLAPAVEPLMRAIRDFFSEFSAGSAVQGAAKSALTSFFTTVLGWASRAMRAIHIAFLEAQIGALKLFVFLAPLVRIFRAIFTNAEVLRGLKTIFVIIAGAIGLVVLAIASVGATFLAIWTVVSFVVGAISTAISFVIGVIVGFVQSLAEGGGAGAKGFITGIVDGLKSGAGMVADAVKQLASGALDAFTSFFQIKSPSRLMKKQAREIPAGAAEGVEEGSADVDRAVEEMYTPKARRKVGALGGGPTRIVNIEQVNFMGAARDFPRFRALMDQYLEELAAGGPEPELEGA